MTVSRAEAHARLAKRGLTYVETLHETVELWRTSAGADVWLTPEPDGTGDYEEEMIRGAEALA